MNNLPPRAVGDLLVGALPQISDRLVNLRIRQAWGALVGKDIARRSCPEGFAGGTLRVVVDNSPWLHELTLREGELARRIRARFPEVQTVRVTLGALDSDAAEARETTARAVALTPADHADIDAAAAAIADTSLAGAARRLLTTARRFPRPRPQGPRGAV
jgi:hypothetical protein